MDGSQYRSTYIKIIRNKWDNIGLLVSVRLTINLRFYEVWSFQCVKWSQKIQKFVLHSNLISKNNQNNFNCETVIISKVIKSFDCRAYHQVSLILPGLYMYNLKGIITDKIVLFLSHLVFCSPQEIYDFTMWYFLSAKGTRELDTRIFL